MIISKTLEMELCFANKSTTHQKYFLKFCFQALEFYKKFDMQIQFENKVSF